MRRIVNLRPDEILDEVTIHSYESGARHQTICFVVHVACSEEALLRTTEHHSKESLRDLRNSDKLPRDRGSQVIAVLGHGHQVAF